MNADSIVNTDFSTERTERNVEESAVKMNQAACGPLVSPCVQCYNNLVLDDKIAHARPPGGRSGYASVRVRFAIVSERRARARIRAVPSISVLTPTSLQTQLIFLNPKYFLLVHLGY